MSFKDQIGCLTYLILNQYIGSFSAYIHKLNVNDYIEVRNECDAKKRRFRKTDLCFSRYGI